VFQSESDARADSGGVVFVAFANALWRKTDAARSECIPDFLEKVDKLIDPILEKYGLEGQSLLAELRAECQINTSMVHSRLCSRNASATPSTAAAAASSPQKGTDNVSRRANAQDAAVQSETMGGADADGPVKFVQPLTILDFSDSWAERKRRIADLNALYARRRGQGIAESGKQEELLREARDWAEALLKERVSEVQDVFELKGRVVKETWTDFVPMHPNYSGRRPLYRPFESALWETGWPSLEDLAIAAIRDRAPSEAIGGAVLEKQLQFSDQPPSASEGPDVIEHDVGTAARERRFCRTGDHWTVTFGDKSAPVKHTRGMEHIAVLLRSPGRSFGCIELAQVSSQCNRPGATVSSEDQAALSKGFSRQPLQDRETLAQINRELKRLDEALADAEARHDVKRIEDLQTERDAVLAQVKKSSGRGGRSRAFSDEDEKARKAVGVAIQRAISMMAKLQPQLAQHLTNRIDTGIDCCYRSDGVAWEIRTENSTSGSYPPHPPP